MKISPRLRKNHFLSVVDSAPGSAATSLNHAEYQRRELPIKRET
nr:hypothetical protein [Escherichia albertii]